MTPAPPRPRWFSPGLAAGGVVVEVVSVSGIVGGIVVTYAGAATPLGDPHGGVTALGIAMTGGSVGGIAAGIWMIARGADHVTERSAWPDEGRAGPFVRLRPGAVSAGVRF